MTLARWLALAASPSFGLMTVANLIVGDPVSNTLCSATGVPSFGGMTTMYALMCLFHTQPWLRLISSGQATFQLKNRVDRDLSRTVTSR